MPKAVRLADIAEKLNVSTVTVSKALSGQKGVSEALRQRIRSLADEMGYVPPSSELREPKNKSYTLGVLIAERYLDKYNSFYLSMYQQVTQRAMSRQCFTLMETVSGEAEQGEELPEIVKEGKAEGLIIIGRLKKEYLDFLNERAGIPLIYLDFCDKREEADAVISDSYYGAYRMTNYLFDMGHERIAYVGTLLSTGSITDRYMGYVRSLMEHNVKPRRDWIIEDRARNHGRIDPEKYLRLPKDMPTAFVCNCDLAASYLIRRLTETGYRVPEDVSVVGYDNFLYPGMCDIGITTYEVDAREMARRAVLTLIKKIAGEDYRQRVYIVEGHMVLKDSVKKIK